MFRKIASYSIGLYVTVMIAVVIRVLIKSIVAKTLGKEALGAYAFFANAQDMGISILAFGLINTVAKQVAAASKTKSDYGQIVAAVMALLAGLSILLASIALFLRNQLDWVWVCILISTGPVTLLCIAQSTLRGQFKRNHEFAVVFIGIGLYGVCVISMTMFAPGLKAPVIGVVIANLLTAAIILAYFIRRQPAYWQLARLRQCYVSTKFHHLLHLAAPLWITDILVNLNHRLDLFILEGQLGFLPLAEYAAAFTFVGLLIRPLTILSQMFMVVFAKGFYTDPEKFRRASSLSLASITTLGLVVTVISIPLAPIIFTKEYTLTPTLVAILSLAYVFKSVEALSTALTISQDYPQANRNATIWNTILYLPLAFFLVSRFGVIGAVWSNVFSWAGFALIHALYMRQRLPVHGAYAIRQMLLGAVLYIGTIWIIGVMNASWLILAIVPAYLGLGQLLHLWDLTEIPDLVYRLLPDRFTKGASND